MELEEQQDEFPEEEEGSGIDLDSEFFMNEHEKKIEKLKEQLKLLQWHKAANEAALKAAITKAKKLKVKDKYAMLSKINHEERVWRKKVMDDEWEKPLQVSYDYFTDFKTRKEFDEERLDDEVRIHIENLKKLKITLKFKEDEHMRRETYNKKRAEYFNEGPYASARSNESTMWGYSNEPEPFNKPEDIEKQRISQYQQQQQSQLSSKSSTTRSNKGGIEEEEEEEEYVPNSDEMQETLDNVINNLDQLVQLEKRIEHLEKLAQKASKQVSFKKHINKPRMNDPGRILYAVKPTPQRFPSINNNNNNSNSRYSSQRTTPLQTNNSNNNMESSNNINNTTLTPEEKHKAIRGWIDNKKKQDDKRHKRIQMQSRRIQQRQQIIQTVKEKNEEKSSLKAKNDFKQMKKQFDQRKDEILLGSKVKRSTSSAPTRSYSTNTRNNYSSTKESKRNNNNNNYYESNNNSYNNSSNYQKPQSRYKKEENPKLPILGSRVGGNPKEAWN